MSENWFSLPLFLLQEKTKIYDKSISWIKLTSSDFFQVSLHTDTSPCARHNTKSLCWPQTGHYWLEQFQLRTLSTLLSCRKQLMHTWKLVIWGSAIKSCLLCRMAEGTKAWTWRNSFFKDLQHITALHLEFLNDNKMKISILNAECGKGAIGQILGYLLPETVILPSCYVKSF